MYDYRFPYRSFASCWRDQVALGTDPCPSSNTRVDAYHNAAKSYKKSDPEGETRIVRATSAALRVRLPLSPPFPDTLSPAAVTALHRAIQLLMKNGSFRQAADREKEVRRAARVAGTDRRPELTPRMDGRGQIAQVFQTDNLDLGRARDSFVRAGELYKQEEANA